MLGTLALWAVVPVAGHVASASATATRQAAPACASSGPAGATERAAEAVVERFLHTAVVQLPTAAGVQAGGCPSGLAVAGLVAPRYETRYPQRADGWYQLTPRIRNAKGLWEYAGFLWVDAPDAAPAAFEVLLELHGDRWLVSSFTVAPGSAEIDMSKAPT